MNIPETKMGKLQSKHVCKRRENPEGNAFKDAVDCIGEVDRNGDKQDLCGKNLKEDHLSDHFCALEVTLPRTRGIENRKSFISSTENGQPLKDALRRIETSDNLECNASLIDENFQEWTIPLYDLDNNGKVTKENMLRLMHSIYEMVEVSVQQLELRNGTTLRVKLSVTPLPRGNRKDCDIKTFRNEQDQMEDNIRCAEGQPSQIGGQSSNNNVSARKHYPVDENTERRNHYLDLAGIENYTSQFEAEPSSEEHQDISNCGHQRRSYIDAYNPMESSGRSVSFLRSLRSHSKSIGGSRGTAKPSKLHGHHPVTWCQPSQQQPQHHSSSKRIRTRARDATAPSRTNQGSDRELQPGQTVPPGGFKSVPQRHEHYHHHEHHHHHHYHHYHPT